jgi:4-hydroxy-tetrahydrodipicolinate synthase
MSPKLIHGVYAAVLTPRLDDGSLDVETFRGLVQFLLDKGIQGFAVNGATGEFPVTAPADLRTQLQVLREVSGGSARMLCGVGSASLAQSLALVRIAEAELAHGLLIPAPFFFRYGQEDVAAWATEIANSSRLPSLLYNLPQFATGFEAETVQKLVDNSLSQDTPKILGIKDSSGSLGILQALTESQPSACRIVGNDSALAPALEAGVCDGVVSGVACVLPEVILALYAAKPGTPEFQRASGLLNEFLDKLGPFPTPWGLKWIAEARKLLTARFAQPVAPARLQAAHGLQNWFTNWLSQATKA